ncbi:MAG: hypothetical protein U5J99_13055 [Parvularculaceae bacterium]|nr:hypothetical protein [Parvularculaceae bacterium]
MIKQKIWVASASLAFVVVTACGVKEKAVPKPAEGRAAIEAEAQDPSKAFLVMAERHARTFLASAPEAATELGVSEEIAGAGYLARLGRYGFDAHQSARAMNEAFPARTEEPRARGADRRRRDDL